MSAENYFLSPGEFAKKQKITVETLKKRRQRGFYDGQFKNINGKIFYKPRASLYASSPGNKSYLSRERRRGAHLQGAKTKYPNHALKQHNELKMLARLKEKVDPVVQDLLPEAIEIAKQNKLKKLQENLNTKPEKSYGGLMTGSEYQMQLNQERQRLNYKAWQKENNYERGFGNSFYITGKPYGELKQDNYVEVVPNRQNDNPSFTNKIEEAIYYAKRRN